MKTLTMALGAILFISGCDVPTFEKTRSMALSDNLQRNTIAKATCSRGKAPFWIDAMPDGSAIGKIRFEPRAKGEFEPDPIRFPLTFAATGPRVITLEIAAGNVTTEAVSEVLSPVLTGGKVVLRGESFDCGNIQVRP